MAADEGRKTCWNDRYRSQSNRSLEPEPFLVGQVSFLKPGSVLDLASGEGRNSVFLAEKGFKVSALDFSEVALDRLRNLSNENNLHIETIALDLTSPDNFKKLNRFDNIIIVHFKLRDDLLALIPSLLNRGGIFLYCTFNQRQMEVKTFPEEFCLKKGELVGRKWALKLLKYTSFKDDRGYQDAYLFEKSPGNHPQA